MADERNCSVFGVCGGCSLLDVPYKEQLAEKDSRIGELFSNYDGVELRPIIGMDDPFRYRDKIIAPFVYADGSGKKAPKSAKRDGGASKNRKIVSGMYRKGTHKVIESDGCLLENELGQKVATAIKRIMQKHGIAPYDEDTGKGFLRHAVVRIGHNSNEVLVTLVTNSDEFPHSKSFCKELISQVPEITTVVQNVNMRNTNVVLGDRDRVLYGPGFILDRLCDLSFRISPQSFYQVNSAQTEVLYDTAIELADVQGKTVIDAYCGTGTLGLIAASKGAKEVIGFDCVESAIRDARKNAQHNGIENAKFLACDADDFLHSLAISEEQADVLFMDPPRTGSTEEFLRAVCEVRPKSIVYVSCEPKTQARDIAYLTKHGYALEVLQPVDMFPHTPHIESIALLRDSKTS